MIRAHVLCCGGTGCTSSGSQKIQDAFVREIEKQGLSEEVKVVQTGCFGLCALGPVVILYPDGTFYSRVAESDVAEIVSEHLLKGRPVERLVYNEKDETTGAVTESLNDTTSTSPSTVWHSVTAASSTPRTSRSTSPWTATPLWVRF